MHHFVTGNETEHKADQPSPADVQGGPPVPAPSVTESTQPALFTRCGWCKAVMVEGPLSPEGLESTGICAGCKAKETADVLANVQVYAPIHVIPSEHRLGGYVIRDDRERLLADRIFGINTAAALAHILNRAVHGFGLCLLHLGERRQDGSCFPCSLKAERHPFAAVGRS